MNSYTGKIFLSNTLFEGNYGGKLYSLHTVSLVNPLKADSINPGIKFIAMLKILFSMHAVGALMTQS